MPRKPRELVNRGCYHLIARGNNRQFIFRDEEAFHRFLELLANAKAKYPAKLYHYCLMSNHIHLLMQIEQAEHLSKFMQRLLQGYGRWYKSQFKYWGHVWQGRYKSPRVAEESYYLEAGRYIERNPLRAKMVQNLKDYPWSSYSFYAFGEPNSLLDEDPYYANLGKTNQERQQAYQTFIKWETAYATVLDEHLLETAF